MVEHMISLLLRTKNTLIAMPSHIRNLMRMYQLLLVNKNNIFCSIGICGANRWSPDIMFKIDRSLLTFRYIQNSTDLYRAIGIKKSSHMKPNKTKLTLEFT